MAKKVSRKGKKLDINQLAKAIVDRATSDQPDEVKPVDPTKDPAAVHRGHLGGIIGGKARAAALSPKKRSSIARKAAKARWQNHKSADATE